MLVLPLSVVEFEEVCTQFAAIHLSSLWTDAWYCFLPLQSSTRYVQF